MSSSEMNLGQSVGIQVIRNPETSNVVCWNCGNNKVIDTRCEYCGEQPKEKE